MPAQTHETAAPAEPGKRPQGWLTIQFTAAAALVMLADALFYGHPLGISLALFLCILAAASACLNPLRAEPRRRWHAIVLLAAGLLPAVEDISWLSVTIALVAAAVAARMLTEARQLSWQEHLWAALRMPLSGLRLFSDIARASRSSRQRHSPAGILAALLGWAMPLLLCAVFATLFVSANPLLESWLKRIDLQAFLGQIFSGRSVFWAVTLCLIWPLLRIRSLRRRKRAIIKPSAAVLILDPLDPFSDRTIRRSLSLFNGLFAIQTAMDLVYLWGGASLPEGLSHASYAHRGAYPLVVTALLAAAFVLVAMRPSGSSERDPLVRPLVLAWVGQNLLLVLSALRRLDLYVEAFYLTELRVAAFIWMLLVATGLVLIIIQILSRRTVGWLVSANAIALALTLYGYSFVDTAVVIANYNIRHSFEMRGQGQTIDIAYLFGLGPSVVPALDRYAPRILAANHISPRSPWARPDLAIASGRQRLVWRHLGTQADWLGWSFRGWRLSRYLANTPEAPFRTIPMSPAGAAEGR
ncbi:MAG: DUF4173 domain-containing protein [Bosea sp.]|uniref:DUF4153 domain-containing protein n=1 Tax=unclassified Bosea (in: a-proteobacteria) TaxID=2653178 RepID=UPI000A9D9DB3|nr:MULTISPECIES: DUF4173 domain-containing protein [unclassified Bosea (in: a-proteobacteria)]MBN9459501.1 DUF4173 domain-containing protein [Bosea sp. (in: a-proteobacteria)]